MFALFFYVFRSTSVPRKLWNDGEAREVPPQFVETGHTLRTPTASLKISRKALPVAALRRVTIIMQKARQNSSSV